MKWGKPFYAIRLGRILKIKRWRKPEWKTHSKKSQA
jgi:hypothetical protein